LLDTSHTHSADSEYCETCGQRLPPGGQYTSTYGQRSKSNRIGIAISVGLHLLAVLYYLFKPAEPFHRSKPPSEGTMVYISPLPQKPNKPEKKTEVAKAKPPPPQTQRRVATITPPAAARPKLETYVPPVVAPMTPPPVEDMADMIAKRRAQRQANNPTPAEPAPETADERGNRIAKANIARAQGGKSAGADRDDTGGVFSIVDQTYHSADVKFRGWNTNFKRNWSQQVHVEQGSEIDIETAIVKKMIELIRKEKPGDFVWESHRLGREVPMSARKEDEAELQAFLLKEFFPEYRRGASR